MKQLHHSHPAETGSLSKLGKEKARQKSKKHKITVKFTGAEPLHLTKNHINHAEN